ncbi:hypothetical protein [Streptomyces katsurahamanus]|uniref:Scaffolding protein n=1 Tax=Streptomyces katsurahamanus TaxID=2577098 RepID=A0ABW9P034_9ACTN|nr:hypothetical protein [Streptomyces katsurahamanus]MQS38881.1 hypothetical protein [Streptomyces katsurahamanus]
MPDGAETEETPETPEEKPQEPAQEPVSEEPTKETTPPAPTPEKPAQGSEETSTATAKAEAAEKLAAEATAKAAALEVELNRERIARKHGIPDDLVPFLRAESLEVDAKVFSDRLMSRGSSLGIGGLDPTDNADPVSDGTALADRILSKNNPF